MGCFKRTASEHVYYLGWNRSPAQVGCMRQALGPGALGRPRGSGWRGRWEGGSGWGTHVNPWLFHFNVWQNSLQKKKNYNEILLHASQNSHHQKKSTNNKCWRGCREKGTLLYCWWECKLVQPLWRTVWRFRKKLKIELPHNPAIPFLGIYPEKIMVPKDICTSVIPAELLTMAKIWEQPPSTDE